MGGKSKAPKAPDPQDTSAAQTSTNIGSAIANNIMGMTSQYDPSGSLEYNQTGTQQWTDPYTGKSYQIPTYESVKRLNPTAQKTFDFNQNAEQNLARTAQDQSAFLGGYLKDRLSADSLPGRGSVPFATNLRRTYDGADDFSADRKRYEQAILGRMAPQMARDRQALETDLVNRGVNIGSEAYGDAKRVQGSQENDARLAAILAGGEEQARMVGMARDAASFYNSAVQGDFANRLTKAQYADQQRGQALDELFAFRNQPINEIAALLAGSQVQMPQFANYQSAGIPTTDVSGNIWNAYKAESDRVAQKNAQSSALWGNLIGAGGKLLTAGIA